MGNYYGVGRSNYVRVTDLKKAQKIGRLFGCRVDPKDDMICFIASSEDGDVNSHCFAVEEAAIELLKEILPENEVERLIIEEEISLPGFMETVATVLEAGQVFVWMHVGHEKSRYLNGYTAAINAQGESVNLALDDIYQLAKTLGPETTQAQC